MPIYLWEKSFLLMHCHVATEIAAELQTCDLRSSSNESLDAILNLVKVH